MKLKVFSVIVLVFVGLAVPAALAKGGFDEYGYNRAARVFVGTGETWAMGKLGYTHEQAEAYMGAYAHDRLVMKWNAEWDRGNAEGWGNGPYAAWCSNEWNGASGLDLDGTKAEGSGEVWHYKIIWVGPELEGSPYWREGGYAIWSQFEVVMDQGTAGGQHLWYAHATPTGYGGY